ncbi:SSI family serine proteinase inhibitor [Nocardiopsis sp. RSe5-2]|uniref:SSI family serine proteinase inhibitor n=1 Tax=Nocardiopsis endophytica TaxID=3018445 RepID=A0ABT4UAE0_9ACTN|nr:SSI family serine proteinase inhibitor [Nocardiopsis endophytica]MDA2813924.1 SSI family serine proteinase inhibitor [Nocardiopsis endophytica]
MPKPRTRTALAGLAAAGAAALAAVSPALADEEAKTINGAQQILEQQEGGPYARMSLEWKYEDGPGGGRATLECHPAGGSHPDRAVACESLTEAGGDFERLRDTGEACTLEYRPVVVSAEGNWFERPVDYTETFGNLCRAKVGTDRVFDF